MEKNQQTKEVSLTNNQEQAVKKLDDLSTVLDIQNLAAALCESKLIPKTFDTPEKALVAILQGKELGMSAVTSLYNMYFIAGKPVLTIHAINGLLTQKGIAFKTVKDYVKEINPNDPDDFDRVTAITFYRKHEKLGMVIEETVEYSMKEAVKAGLGEKETWGRYPKIMLWNRTFTFGARRIASDVLMGLMEVSEAGDTFNKSYKVSDEGTVSFEEIK